MKNKITLLLLVMFTFQANAQINSTNVNNIAYEEMIRQNLPGFAIGIYNNGASYLQGYGHIDLNRTKAITLTTQFRWASISKTLTAVALLQVSKQKGNFSINDKVTEHFPYWIAKVGTRDVTDKSKKSNITIKHLLTQRSGINHYAKGVDYNKQNYKSDAGNFSATSCVNVFRDMAMLFSPGDKYYYSTYGYNLLGAVIDGATGSYTKWVKDNIADKMRMSSLRVSNGSFYGFQKNKDGIINSSNIINKEYVLPGGGWESNIGDLLKFARGIITNQFLGSNTSMLWTDDGYKDSKGKEQDYKRGINSRGSSTSENFRAWHGGTHANLTTMMYLLPNKNIAIVLMIPMQSADRWNLIYRIVNELSPGFYSNVDTSPLDKCNSSMKNSGKNYIGVWRKTQEDVIIRRGYSTDNFNKEWQFLTSKGYHLENFSYTDNLWNGIFKKGRGQYAMWRNFDQAGFNTKWVQMNNSGYRLYDLETYLVNGQRKWAGLFKKGSGKYALFRNLTTKDFGSKRAALAKQGLKLIDIEVFSEGGQLKWSGVWEEGTDGLLNRNYNNADFMKLVITRRKIGYQLIDIETYLEKGVRKWAGIWEKSSQSSIVTYPRSYCQTMGFHETNSKNGYELIDFESY